MLFYSELNRRLLTDRVDKLDDSPGDAWAPELAALFGRMKADARAGGANAQRRASA